ncbi:hypothetical protein ACFW16_21475 [Inquilinus sp. NPDC058860]|uniref:hypothetical protein n=1 Tax=Inquilinus sp. NPDC058860 TaxID=3346652 RepID=UPI0036919E78
MSVIQIADDRALPATAPAASIRTALASRQDEILSLRQNASEILYRLRAVRETWSDTDLPPAQERWVLQQVIECLTVSCEPPTGDEFDRIAVAGQALAMLFDMSDEDFEAAALDGDTYDLVDFDADLDDAEDLAAANA